MEGTVKFYNRKKGFGFIQGNDGNDYFVHYTAIPEGVFLRDNDLVSFDSAEGDRGLKAENVQLLTKGSERDDLPQETSEEDTEETPVEEETSEENTEETPVEEETNEENTEETPVEEETSEEDTESTEKDSEEPKEE